MFFRKFLSLVAPLLFFVFFQLANKYPGQMLYWGIGGIGVSVISLFLLRRLWLKEKVDFKIFWSSTFLFLLGSFLTFVFLDRPIFRQVLIFIASFLFFLKMFYSSLYLQEKKSFYLGNLSVLNEVVPVLAFFLLASGFFGWLVFLNNILWVFVILLSFVALQTSFNLFYNTLGKDFAFSSLWVISLISAEIFWALNFLPVGFLVKGFIMAIGWWVVTKTLIGFQRENKKAFHLYVFSLGAVILITIILLSSRWI